MKKSSFPPRRTEQPVPSPNLFEEQVPAVVPRISSLVLSLANASSRRDNGGPIVGEKFVAKSLDILFGAGITFNISLLGLYQR